MSPRSRLGLAVAAQLLLASGLLFPALLDGLGAQEVTLETAPVDPRDLLRGQYMALGYKVSRVQAGPGVRAGRVAYLPLQRGAGGLWTGERAVSTRPEGGVFLRGRVEWVGGGQATLNYGIERFYLSEGTAQQQGGQRAEGQRAEGLRTRVLVSPSGRAHLRELWRGSVRLR